MAFAGEQNNNYGFAFVLGGSDARTFSLGNSVAIANQWNQSSWNPAGSSFAKTASVSLDYSDFEGSLNNYYWSGGFNSERFGSMGFVYQKLFYGKIPRTSPDQPEGTGESYEPWERIRGINYSYKIFKFISIGAQFKNVTSHIDLVKAHANLLDIGIMSRVSLPSHSSNYSQAVWGGFSVGDILIGDKPVYKGSGLVLINTSTANDSLAINFLTRPFDIATKKRVGVAYELTFKNNKQSNWFLILTHLSYMDVEDTYQDLRFGLELTVFDMASVRFVTKNLKEEGIIRESFITDRLGLSLALPLKRLIGLGIDLTPRIDYSHGGIGLNRDIWSFSLDANL